MLQIDIITIFPKMFSPVLGESIIKRAQQKKKVKINLCDLRDFTPDKHRKVDDRPFGGGPGMVMRPEPIFNAVAQIKSSIKHRAARTILLSPKGKLFNQSLAKKLSKSRHIILICGHYEGVDERVKKIITDEISIGDYVLTGGELPAMVLVDAIIRLIPGVLGDKDSSKYESFESGLLEHPHYTRPANYRGMKVPAILLSGNHEKIQEWRKQESLKRTQKLRPDLLMRPKLKER